MNKEGRLEGKGDIAAQLAFAVENLESVLAAAGMTLGDLPRRCRRRDSTWPRPPLYRRAKTIDPDPGSPLHGWS